MAGADLGPVDSSSYIRHLQGEDPTAYVLSANIHRRHMTTGQRAMAVAMLYPEPEKLRRKGSSPSKTEGLSAARILEARTVLNYSRELAVSVVCVARGVVILRPR